MSTSSQYLSVPQSIHRPSQHRKDRGLRHQAQSQEHHQSVVADAASSSKVKLEDTPLGIHAAPPAPTRASPVQTARTLSPTPASSSPTPPSHTLPSPPSASSTTLQLFPRRIFSVMPFLVRLRSPRSDSLSLSCTSGVPRTHTALCKNQLHKATQPLTYSRTLVCADAVNAEVLLRFARNELLERAQLANRHVTALVDEEWQYTIQQIKSGYYNVQVSYSACPAQYKKTTTDPRKPIALSHVTNIPGLMRIVQSE